MLPVPQHHVPHVADAEPVHQDAARGHLLAQGQLVHVHLDDLADFGNDDILAQGSHGFGQHRVLPEHAVFPVHGDKVFRPDQRVHQLQLLLARVPGDVHLRQGAVDHLGPQPVQLVDDPGNVFFVSGNGRGGDNDHVALADLELPVLRVGHPGQPRHGLALASRRHDQHLVVRELVQHVHVDQPAFGDFQLADAHRDAADVDHAAADEADAPAVADAVVDDHLHPVDIAGEHGDDDPAVRLGEELLEGFSDFVFAHGIARPLHIRGFTQQGHDAALAVSGQRLQIRDLPVDRGIVDLEVAAHDHRSRRAGNGDGAGASDGMAHMDEFAHKAAQLHHVPGTDHVNRDVVHPVFLQLQVHQGHGQLRPVDMGRNLFQDVGRGADMILVPVGKKEAPDVVLFPNQVGHVRDDQIHPEHILLGKHAPAVHDDDVVLIFKNGHVLADFIHAAQRNNPELADVLFSYSSHPYLLFGCMKG